MKFLKNEELGRPEKEQFSEIPKLKVTIVLDNVRSGLNTGSIFRSADSFLVERIVLCGITARPPEREILKTALGATETVPWTYESETRMALKKLRENGYFIYAVEQSDNSELLHAVNPAGEERYALVFGNEVKGVDPLLIPLIDSSIEVPQSGTKHSLNIAVCAGIVLWKFYERLCLKA
jgi:23S rRNA (guanosine2251-2'-O)-methyltransferase